MLEKDKFTISIKKLTVVSLLYAYIPIALFLLTWVKSYISVPVVLLGGFLFYRFLRDISKEDPEGKSEAVFNERAVEIDIGIGIIVLLFVVVLGYLSGWTYYVPQAGDWGKHNALLHDLLEYEWPVYYKTSNPAMLTYYIGQYIVPALIGKMFHSFGALYIGLFIWNGLGTIILILWIFLLTNANSQMKKIIALVVFFVFSGALCLAQTVGSFLIETPKYEMHWFDISKEIFLQYTSFFTSMRWVAPQFIVPGILTLLWVSYRKNIKFYAFILMPLMLFGTFQFLGLCLMCVIYLLFYIYEERKDFKKIALNIFSVYNVAWILTAGIIFLLYFAGNILSPKPDMIGFGVQPFLKSANYFICYIIFCLCMFGIHCICIAPKFKNEKIFYAVCILLAIIPWFKMGKFNDFCMRVSIVPLMVLFVMVVRYLFEKTSGKKMIFSKAVLIILLCIGAKYPIEEIQKELNFEVLSLTKVQLFDIDRTLTHFTELSDDDKEKVDLKYNYFTYNPQDSFWSKYIARKPYQIDKRWNIED